MAQPPAPTRYFELWVILLLAMIIALAEQLWRLF